MKGNVRDKATSVNQLRGLNSIRFVRHRMLYGKPIMNAHGHVCCGLRHIHALNRSRDVNDRHQTIHIMKYIFPKQFGLHNVLSSDVDPKETAQPFKDYTLREQEVKRTLLDDAVRYSKIPRRLRGKCENMIGIMRRRHARCSYTSLLQHYCPIRTSESPKSTTALDGTVLSLATPAAQVSAYCRGVVDRILLSRFWGEGPTGVYNKTRIMNEIHRFVLMRRYESMTLHDVMHNMKIANVHWLAPPDQSQGAKLAVSDFQKRREIFAELIYYLFDSFLIPLISSNFYVTDSSTSRNQLFYFRHDVWKSLSEPALSTMKLSMFEELQPSKIKRLLSRRSLGTSQVRLLPKESGLRPIINLRRRGLSRTKGDMVLARSINSILTPAFNVLNYEKVEREATFALNRC